MHGHTKGGCRRRRRNAGWHRRAWLLFHLKIGISLSMEPLRAHADTPQIPTPAVPIHDDVRSTLSFEHFRNVCDIRHGLFEIGRPSGTKERLKLSLLVGGVGRVAREGQRCVGLEKVRKNDFNVKSLCQNVRSLQRLWVEPLQGGKWLRENTRQKTHKGVIDPDERAARPFGAGYVHLLKACGGMKSGRRLSLAKDTPA